MGVWAAAFTRRRHGGLVLIALSVLLLLVGGGFGPPLIAGLVGLAATRNAMRNGARHARPVAAGSRALGRLWPWMLAVGVAGYVGLLPGVVLLDYFLGVGDARLVAGLTALAFGGLLLALVAARAADLVRVATSEATNPRSGNQHDETG